MPCVDLVILATVVKITSHSEVGFRLQSGRETCTWQPKVQNLLNSMSYLPPSKKLDDPRSSINRRPPLVSVRSIVVRAVLWSADAPTSIRYWAEARREFLGRFLNLPNGLPSRDAFRRVLCAPQAAAFQQYFDLWTQAMTSAIAAHSERRDQEPEGRHRAIDGKTLKGSRDESNRPRPQHWSVYRRQ